MEAGLALVFFFIVAAANDDNRDQFGIRRLFPSVDPKLDWVADWDLPRVLFKAKQADPFDTRSYQKGEGSSTIGGGELIFSGKTPRMYIEAAAAVAPDPVGTWLNTEFTAYGRIEAWRDDRAGFTLISRTNHDGANFDPCEAHGYYARVVFSSGLILVKKEFRHSNVDGIAYSHNAYSGDNATMTVVENFDYSRRFLGIKSVVRDNPDGRSVNLRVYIDTTEGVNGGDWQLFIDYDDFDLASLIPSGCEFSYAPPGILSDRAPVLRPGRVAILRSDNVRRLHWKWVSIREIAPI